MPVNVRYRVAWWRRWLSRPLAGIVLRTIFHGLSSVRLDGQENIPYGQAYVVAFNHISTYDPPFVGVFWPEQLEAMGAVDVWNRPGQNILARLWGGIPVHRGDYDRALFDQALGALATGHPMLIAPEGGRSHTPGMRQAKPGLAYLLDESQVPVIPVGIVGATDEFWQLAIHGKRPQIAMYIGRPFVVPPLVGRGAERREARQANTDLVMRYIAGLLPEEYRGYYGAAPIFQKSLPA
jgi:1-acyl-sn-glycerol-3-phosphate acyltransferase